MTTTNIERGINFNKIYKNKKRINIIIRDMDGNTLKTETIIYDRNKHNNLYSISELVSEKYKYDGCLLCGYDQSTKIEVLYNNARSKGDHINWALDFYNISIEEALRFSSTNAVTIIVLNSEGDIGCASGFTILDNVLNTLELLKILAHIVNRIKIHKNPFKQIESRYYVNKEIIEEVINKGEKWKEGFITDDINMPYKKLVEKRVMKKMGYKKNNGIWKKENKISKYHEKLFF